MDAQTQRIGTKVVLNIGLISLIGNGLGATLVFIYFSAVDPGSHGQGIREPFLNGLAFFIVGMTGLMILIFSIARLYSKRLRKDLNEKFYTANTYELRLMAGRLLNMPVRMTGLSVLGWFLAGIIFTFVSNLFGLIHDNTLERMIRSLFGTWFVGGPITCVFVYFVLEGYIRHTAIKIFPPEALTDIPPATKIRLEPKMLVVSMMLGTLPAAMISAITMPLFYWLKYHPHFAMILSDPTLVAVKNAVDTMPYAILFLMGFTLLVACGLSIAIARSIVDPMHRAIDAMARIGKGDLDVSVPVVSNDEIGLMGAGFNEMAQGLKERDMIRHTFGAYVSEDIAAEVLKGSGALDRTGQLRDVTILVSDLRGFTKLTATLEPEQVLMVVNRYLSHMTDVILQYGGTIDEFTGDGILVFFGAPRQLEDHAKRAVACALDMQRSMESLNQANLKDGLPTLQMGIGIDSGELVVGNIGSDKRKKYAAVGTPINVAFRVEAHTAGGEILVTPTVTERLENLLQISSQREAQLKGIEGSVTLYQISGML